MRIFNHPRPAAPAKPPEPQEQPATTGAGETSAEAAEGDEKKGHGIGKRAIGGVLLVGAAAPMLAGCNSNADLPKVELPTQNLDQFSQELPAEAKGQEALAHAVEQYENGQDPYVTLNVKELYNTVVQDASKTTVGTPIGAEVESEMVEAVVTTHAAIHAQTDDYVQARTNYERAHDAQGFHIRDSAEVKALGARVDTLKDQLIEMRAVHGGASIVLAQDDVLTGSELSGNVDEAQKAVDAARAGTDHAAWVKTVSQQLKLNEQVKTAEVKVTKEQNRRAGNTVDFRANGYSEEGPDRELLKAGLNSVIEANTLNDSLEALKGLSQNNCYTSIDKLLRDENTQYKLTRETYDVLKPVHDQIPSVTKAAGDAKAALRYAEQAIIQRNAIRDSEPAYYETVYQPVYNDAGVQIDTEAVQVHSQAHKDWEWRYSNAKWQAASAAESAESKVHKLNNEVSELRAYLKVGNMADRLGNVDSQISWFVGQEWSWGIWSYDSSQVGRIESQIDQLSINVGVIQGEVDRDFHASETAVWKAIHAREGELLQMK